MTVQFNPITNYYDYVPPGSGGGPVPPVVIPPLLQPYDPAWAYLTGDYVISADTIWEALAPSTGVLPGTNPLIWQQVIPGPALLPPYIPVYDIAYAYDAGRYVMSADKIWLSLGASTGVVPGTNPALWRQVLDLPFIPVWDAGYPYLANQYVMFNDRIYVSLIPSTGVQPDTDPLSWMWVMEKPMLGEWSADYEYGIDQMAVFQGVVYKSLAGANLANQPDVSPLSWVQMLPGPFLNQWVPTFPYTAGQAVHLPGFGIYECINPNTAEMPNLFPVDWKLIIDMTGPYLEYNFLTVAGVIDYVLPDTPDPLLVSTMRVNIEGAEMHYAAGEFTVAGATLSFVPSVLNFIPVNGMPVRVLYKI